MAPETTRTKRKNLDRKIKTSEDAPPAKKAKTTTTKAPAPKPEKVKAAAEAKKNRKRASDFIDRAEVELDEAEPAPKKSKKQKVVAPVEEAAEEPIVAPEAKKAKVEKKSKKTDEPADAPADVPAPVVEKLVKAKKGKKAENTEEAHAGVAEPVEEKSKKAKKEKVDKRSKKTEEVIEPVEAVEDKPVKEKKAKADKKGKKAAAEAVEATEADEITEEATAGASQTKKSKAEKKGKKAAEPIAEIVETTTVETSKSKKGEAAKEAAPVGATDETTVVETTRAKRAKPEKAAKQIVEVTEGKEAAPKSILKKGKKATKSTEEAEDVPTSVLKTKKGSADKTNGESKELISADSLEDAFDGVSSGDEDNIADQTAALLAGFESTDEESEAGDDQGIPLDMIPKAKLDKAAKKALAAAKKDADDVPGTIYVGRIPHGFYEHQMKAYFTQFGDVTRLRLARNKKTGASKHYAFVEFGSQEVAEIVARTMNNYLMFGHIMKLRLMTPEQVHKDLWKGAGKRFKVIPRAKLAARDLAQPKGRDYWRKRIESEEKARAEKMEKLKDVGYEFELPSVRKVEDVAMKGTDEAVALAGEAQAGAGAEAEEAVVDEPVVKAIEPASAVVVDAVEKEVMSVIAKKKAKGKGGEIIGDAVRVTKKSKKEKKSKA